MANVSIWNGSATFVAGMTPFGFYDGDSDFVTDAVKVSKFCGTRLGFPLMDVELQSGSFFACFEEAVTTYGNEVFQYKIRENYLSLEGSTTGSVLNNQLVEPTLERVVGIGDSYGVEAEVGGNVTMYTGSLKVSASIQEYDMDAWATSAGITGSIEVRRVFYEAPPAIMRYFDPYAGTGTGIQSLMDAFDFGSYSPGVNFLLMPASYDMLKVQAIEFNDQIRRSAYTFEINANFLRIFPVPKAGGTLKIQYYRTNEKAYNETTIDFDAAAESAGSVQGSGGGTSTTGISTNLSNVNAQNLVYSEINAIGRQWIFKYTVATCKEMLAYVRGKYQTVPVPGSEVTMNAADLLADAREEKVFLVEDLKATMQTASLTNQLELAATQTKFINDAMAGVPMHVYIG